MRLITALTVAALSFAAQAAEVYKWKDKDGRVHYGDRPKAEQAQEVEIDRSGKGPATGERERIASGQAAREAAAADECNRKKSKLAGYQRASAINQMGADGNNRELTAAERDALYAEVQKEIEAACSPPATP
jgi:hypothetical protein